jgi:CelD/BcsL family acetyltransferase involved in cellulose biosynthesis
MRAHDDAWSAVWSLAGRVDVAAWQEWSRAGSSPLAHVFHRPDLLALWMETIGEAVGARPALAAITHSSGITARLAAVVTPYQGSLVTRRILEPMGQDLFGYHDPCFDRLPPPPLLDGFWSLVRATAPPHDQARFRFVDRRFAGETLHLPASDPSPVLSLDGASSLDEVLARCSSNHRGDVRRRLRRLRERGVVGLRVYQAGEAGEAVRHFGERCWPRWVSACRRLRSDLFQRPGFRAYCDRLLAEGVASGLAHYSALQLDGVDIAWHLGLADRGRLYWWLPAHDEAWDAWSPGKVALALLIEHAVSAGLREVHFQTGVQAYKMAWKPAVPPRVAVGWLAPSLRGRAIGAYDRVRRPAGR